MWTVGAEQATLDKAGGKILHRFKARDLHLVLGPAANGKPVRFRVTVDGHARPDAGRAFRLLQHEESNDERAHSRWPCPPVASAPDRRHEHAAFQLRDTA
jgi:hypothetical protein